MAENYGSYRKNVVNKQEVPKTKKEAPISASFTVVMYFASGFREGSLCDCTQVKLLEYLFHLPTESFHTYHLKKMTIGNYHKLLYT